MENIPYNSKSRVTPPWLESKTSINGVPCVLAHFQDGEIEGLDDMQGHVSIDPETGLKEYSALDDVSRLPEVQEIFHKVSKDYEDDGEFSEKTKKAYKESKYILRGADEPHFTEEEDYTPVRDLERNLGAGGDTRLAWIPLGLVDLLIKTNHVPIINPNTGLLAFGKSWFSRIKNILNPAHQISKVAQLATRIVAGKEKSHKVQKDVEHVGNNVIRVAAPIVGGSMAGPLGAGIGSAISNFVTGAPLKKSLIRGAKVGAGAYVGQGLGQAAGLTSAMPYTGQFFAGSNLINQGLGHLGMSKTSSPTPDLLKYEADMGVHMGPHGQVMDKFGQIYNGPAVNNASTNFAGGVAAGHAANNFMGHGGSQSPSMMDTLSKYAPLLLAANAGASYLGSRKEHKQGLKENRRLEEIESGRNKRAGLDLEWEADEPFKMVKNKKYFHPSLGDLTRGGFRNPFHYIEPEDEEYEDYETGDYYGEPSRKKYAKGGVVRAYKKGTLLKGPGNGQDDKIKTSMPEGGYIIDASSTSNFGDGSSESGGKVLKRFENEIHARFPKHVVKKVEKHVRKNARKIPVYLSNDEYALSPTSVTLLGKGSNEEGSHILKTMVKNIRKQKISKGDKLPPKAKSPWHYIGGRV